MRYFTAACHAAFDARRAATVLVAAAISIVPAARQGHAQTADDVFSSETLHEVRLLVNSRDLLRLRAGYLTNTYYPADFLWNGTRVRNVAIRSRGTGSRNPNKIGLRVDFNRYARSQRFAGLSSIILDNGWQDPSLMREMLAMSFFRRLGQPAPRESFCRLYINNVYQGVYSLIEPIDGAFATRAFNDPGGYLYEYHYLSPFYGEDLGDDLAPYKARFEPQTHELDADTTLYSPLRNLFREINGPDDAVWRERVDALIDLDQFVTQTAIETFLAENDAILGYAGMNNFYVYRGTTNTRFRVLPWDRDYAFTFLESSILRSIDENVIMTRALAQPDLRTRYLDVLDAAADSASENDWLGAEISRLTALIGDAVRADTKKQYSNEDFDQALEFLRTFAATRPDFVRGQVATLR